MSRKASAETQLASLKREFKLVKEQRDRLQLTALDSITRAKKAEQELSEWKTRFDQLLRITKQVES